MVHGAICVWMVLTSESYTRENPAALKYLIVTDNVFDLMFYTSLVLFIHAMNRDLLNETLSVRLTLGVILASIVSHWLYLFMGTGFDACDTWYDYQDENDVMYTFISVFDSIARVMETEGTIFIFEWYYIIWLSVHPTEVQKKNNRSKMRKISHEGRVTRSEKALRELGWVGNGAGNHVHFENGSTSNTSDVENSTIEKMYMETMKREDKEGVTNEGFTKETSEERTQNETNEEENRDSWVRYYFHSEQFSVCTRISDSILTYAINLISLQISKISSKWSSPAL